MTCLVEKQLPFSCQQSPSDTGGLAATNDLVFALLECLSDGITIQRQQDFDSDVARLEHKLNLVIFLLNNLIQPAQSRPAAQTLRLDTEGIAWRDDHDHEPGTLLEIQLFLDPLIPVPLRCLVRGDESKDGWCHARLLGLSEEAMSSWSRWVFRQHRQVIAHTREHGHQPHS